MNKKQIILGLGTLVLAVGGFFAGRANAKFTGNPKLWYLTTGVTPTCKPLLSGTNNFTTGAVAGTTITFITTGQGVIATSAIFENSTCTTALPSGHKVRVQ